MIPFTTYFNSKLFQRYTSKYKKINKTIFLFKFNDLKEVKQFYDEIASAYFPNFELK